MYNRSLGLKQISVSVSLSYDNFDSVFLQYFSIIIKFSPRSAFKNYTKKDHSTFYLLQVHTLVLLKLLRCLKWAESFLHIFQQNWKGLLHVSWLDRSVTFFYNYLYLQLFSTQSYQIISMALSSYAYFIARCKEMLSLLLKNRVSWNAQADHDQVRSNHDSRMISACSSL